MTSASTSYKKQDGTLAVTKSGPQVTITWTPVAPPGSGPSVRFAAADITNLQQTPEKSAKVSIKVFVQRPPATEPEAHTFTFTSPSSARADQVAIVDNLRKAIDAAKSQPSKPLPAPAPDAGGGSSAAMAIAHALAAGAKAEDPEFDDKKLIMNIELQRSLLKENAALRQRFEQALREKPDSISVVQFSQQFWAARVHLLREHAVGRTQLQGTNNVLSAVKARNVDGTTRLNISKEQIQLIFKQHPIVKRVYDENVPKVNEKEFWSGFFQSRLIKKLKGEKYAFTSTDKIDPIFDRYLEFDEFADRQRQLEESQFPRFIDLEGNEQNHSQRKGNAPDKHMQPKSIDKIPILRVLNNMSEKLMAEVAPADPTPHAPAGMDEETFNELQLRDLQRDALDNRIMLKIKDQMRFQGMQVRNQKSAESALYSSKDPAQVIAVLKEEARDMSHSNKANTGLNLEEAIGVVDDSSSDEEQQPQKKQRIGARSGRGTATKQIMASIRQRRSQTDDFSAASGTFAGVSMSKASLLNIDTFETLAMSHNTTVEFLSYFWTVFYSGDAERATEAQKLLETLDKSLDRIKAVADKAEEERKQELEKARGEKQSTQRRRRDAPHITGGAKTVNEMMGPLLRAIGAAKDAYQKALKEEMKNMAQAQAAQ